MTLQRAQSVQLPQLGPGEGAPVAPPAQANYAPSGSSEQPFFRLDILRSLQLHRRLAMGFAVAGLALAVAYFSIYPVGFYVTTFGFAAYLLAAGFRRAANRSGSRRRLPGVGVAAA